MIRSGDTIHNPVTGERITFHQTSADTNGEAVVIECTVQPHGFVAAAHVHPSQTERFNVIEGTLGLKVGKEKRTLGRGEVAVVEPGTPHKFWNAGEDERRASCARCGRRSQFESLLETMFTLAADGKTNRKGMPNPLRLAVIARAHFDTVRLPKPPAWMQRAASRSAPRSGGCSATPPRTRLRRRRTRCRRSSDEAAVLLHPARPGADPARGAGLRGQGRETGGGTGSPARLSIEGRSALRPSTHPF